MIIYLKEQRTRDGTRSNKTRLLHPCSLCSDNLEITSLRSNQPLRKDVEQKQDPYFLNINEPQNAFLPPFFLFFFFFRSRVASFPVTSWKGNKSERRFRRLGFFFSVEYFCFPTQLTVEWLSNASSFKVGPILPFSAQLALSVASSYRLASTLFYLIHHRVSLPSSPFSFLPLLLSVPFSVFPVVTSLIMSVCRDTRYLRAAGIKDLNRGPPMLLMCLGYPAASADHHVSALCRPSSGELAFLMTIRVCTRSR